MVRSYNVLGGGQTINLWYIDFFFFFLFLDPQECHDQSSSRLPPENEEKHLKLPSTICISFKHISATGAVKLLQLDT